MPFNVSTIPWNPGIDAMVGLLIMFWIFIVAGEPKISSPLLNSSSIVSTLIETLLSDETLSFISSLSGLIVETSSFSSLFTKTLFNLSLTSELALSISVSIASSSMSELAADTDKTSSLSEALTAPTASRSMMKRELNNNFLSIFKILTSTLVELKKYKYAIL